MLCLSCYVMRKVQQTALHQAGMRVLSLHAFTCISCVGFQHDVSSAVSDRWHFLVAACQTQGWCEIMSGLLQLSAAPSVGNPLVVLPCSQASVCPITSSFCSSLRAALISIL